MDIGLSDDNFMSAVMGRDKSKLGSFVALGQAGIFSVPKATGAINDPVDKEFGNCIEQSAATKANRLSVANDLGFDGAVWTNL